MTDLFGEPMIPGLRTAPDLVDETEEAELIAHIDQTDLAPFQFGQFEGKRLTRSFGLHYDFSSHRLQEAEPIPLWLHPLREKAARFGNVAPAMLSHVLLIRYDPGAGIGWHKDRPVFDQVIGVSLGHSTILTFRRRRPDGGFARQRLPLPPRSAYHLSGEARSNWEHGIAAHEQRRYSITFRSIA